MTRHRVRVGDEEESAKATDAALIGEPVTLQVTFTPENPEDLQNKIELLSTLGTVEQAPKAQLVEHRSATDAYGNPLDPSARAQAPTHDAYGNKY